MAEPAVRALPAFASRLVSESQENRVSALEDTHPDYDANLDTWIVLLDAFEGSGGFQTGAYLWPYRFELNEDFLKRQEMARYHNYVETIVDLYVRHCFSQQAKRQTKSPELEAWWKNVDSAGTEIDAYMRTQVALALASGHVGILMDRTAIEPSGPTKADEQAADTVPFLVSFRAPSILDWRMDHNTLTGVKLCEAAAETSLDAARPDENETKQYLLWDREGWARFTHKGELIAGDTPNLGMVPLEVVRPKPSILKPFLGRPLFSSAKIVQALFNRMSEEDQVLRDQAFSLLTVAVGEKGDVEQAKKQIGTEFGTTRALVVQGEASYISPDMAVPAGVRENIRQIIREIYRVAHMRFEADSLQSESAESIRLQYTELEEMLIGLASELQRVELQLARFFFAWTSPTPEAADKAFEAAQVTIEYPDKFFLDDLIDDLTAWAEGISLNLGKTMQNRIKIRAAKRIEPDMPLEEFAKVEAEIKAQEDEAQMMAEAANRLRDTARMSLSKQQRPTVGAQ